ncbi:TonB-dependent siderophore myxochelin receptor MxcH [Comamonas sp. JC664]|uniref:TonB-dependent siderophore myxochelin receptor MxcH n=1 Tax=Comamonas sp. JC664 TaxID=2801917 RepID=UPI00174917BA|nr:TonB-dependent siderophore myxochelin receptor MxcH [Comamonas sp. JC664]MBL0693974.1 TonB-dependent siderophore myxochelin receptor MxcH [Comamonas sp. JC664]GHH04016.1 TonB-dependent receptor [Comamonas sp. KCTC 72670]
MFSAFTSFALLLSAAPAEPASVAPPPPSETAPAQVQPPSRIDSVTVPYPEVELAAGREADVVLRLTIDEHGVVTEAEVVQSAGEAFDVAIRTAALDFRFEPARVGGEAVACQIELLHAFRLGTDAPAEPEPVPEPPPEAPPEAPPAPPEEKTLETTVSGRSEAERMRRSAEAVRVVSTTRARARSADMGQVLAAQEGVEVRRSGGLGSTLRFSLNGLTDDQIRFFLDGVPLDLSGYPFGFANVPVNLVDSIQIYRGVVPSRFGADALGGAVNLTSAPIQDGAHGAASLQGGAFGTYRLTLGGSYRPSSRGFFARAHLFADTTRNDYRVDVQTSDDTGQLRPATVSRFHDGYQALGGGLEAGFEQLGWADRVTLRAFGSGYDKDLQHNLVMSGGPFGEARYGATALGTQLLYEKAVGDAVRVDALAGYAWQATDFQDTSQWVYDWFGNRVRERTQPGELGGDATDQTLWQQSFYGRANASWALSPSQTLRLAIAPTLTRRTGEQRRLASPSDVDPLSADRNILTAVTGVEYQLNAFDDAVELIVFGKDYLYAARAQQLLPTREWQRKDRTLHQLGGGAALRLRVAEPVYLKVSYERATRLPRMDELFGNGVLVRENLDLAPETSHNVNAGLATAPLRTGLGVFRGELNGFARLAQDLIMLAGRDRDWRYQNVYGARALGVEGAAGWSSPGGWLHLDANATFQDIRNTSGQGTFGAFEGQRLPNRPWFFFNATARLSLRGVAASEDELSPFWTARYVHGFFRNWGGLGAVGTKETLDNQFAQAAGVGYRVRLQGFSLGLSTELDNVTNARLFDFFGVQRPGRSGWLKATVEY